MRDRDVGKVRIDDLYNLIIVVGEFLKLEIKVIQTSNKLHFEGSRLTTTNSSAKMRFTINRLRLCSNPALQSICLKRIFSSVVSLKLYLWTLGSVVVGRPILFFVVVISLVV